MFIKRIIKLNLINFKLYRFNKHTKVKFYENKNFNINFIIILYKVINK